HNMTLTFLDGVPRSFTMQTTPRITHSRLGAALGFFAQDQWTINRLTVSGGLRFEYLDAFVPAQHIDPIQFVGARDFPEVSHVPQFTDLSPRMSVSYDLFGTGKTAVKASVSRYVQRIGGTGLTVSVNPVLTTSNAASPSWTDT